MVARLTPFQAQFITSVFQIIHLICSLENRLALSHHLYKFHWKGRELYLGIFGDGKLNKSFLHVIIITLFLLIFELQSELQTNTY